MTNHKSTVSKPETNRKMRVLFYSDVNQKDWITDEELKSDFGGDWNEFFRVMYDLEGSGIFDDFNFLKVEEL